ncbi:MAG: glutathione S-transferase family protein [Pseudomonadota bacterium]
MKLLYTGNSPYARRARISVREAGLLAQTEELDLTPREEHEATLLEHGPGGKVPVLVTDDGLSLCESLIINRYLDDLSGGGRLYPANAQDRALTYSIEATASVLLDSLFVRSREKRRPANERSPGVISLEATRAARCLDLLEANGASLGGRVDCGVFTVVVALGYANWRHPEDRWQDGRPTLAKCYETLMQRSAVAETAPVF